jgi:hypothetical protein
MKETTFFFPVPGTLVPKVKTQNSKKKDFCEKETYSEKATTDIHFTYTNLFFFNRSALTLFTIYTQHTYGF